MDNIYHQIGLSYRVCMKIRQKKFSIALREVPLKSTTKYLVSSGKPKPV